MGGSENGAREEFEQQLRDALEHYEVPYNSADWAQMERALTSGVRGWGRGRSWTVGLLVLSALLIGGTAYYLGRDTAPEKAKHEMSQTLPAIRTTTAMPAIVPDDNAANAQEVTGVPANALATDQENSDKQAHRTYPATITPENRNPAPTTRHATAASIANSGVKGMPYPTTTVTGAVAAFHSSLKEACPGVPVDFTVEHMPGDGIYLWNFGDGSFSNKPNPEHVFSKPGNYQVMLSMSSTGAGMIHNKPSSDMIVVHEAPTAVFDLVPQIKDGQVPSVHFENRSQGADSYRWDLGDGSTSSMDHPDHTYTKQGVYQAELTVTNATGCVDKKVKEVRIAHDFNLGAPKSFSPDGDGNADFFMPDALNRLNARFQLSVYDTLGVLEYSTDNASLPWTGRMKNQGSILPAGNYVWVVDIDRGQLPAQTFTGKVQLEK